MENRLANNPLRVKSRGPGNTLSDYMDVPRVEAASLAISHQSSLHQKNPEFLIPLQPMYRIDGF
jgi:hypothetical protein